MIEILGYLFAVVIGIIMGLIGGGGSILSVPVFVYIFKMDAITATSLSLFVVGVTSAIGSAGYFKNKMVDFKTAILFGLPSVFSVIFVRKIILPHIPVNIHIFQDLYIPKNVFILSLFAILMLFSSIKMIWGNPRIHYNPKPQYTLLITQGISVGMITGMIGAGGGFLIVPALVMMLGLDMKKAIGTSLFIIAINSLLGFASSINHVKINWNFILFFSLLSIIGMIIGLLFSRKIDGKKLKPIFGWFVLIMAIYILIKEIFFHSI